MKKILSLSLGMLALASLVSLPSQAQRKQQAKKRTMVSSPTRQPKSGHYLLQGTAPADANGKWVFLYADGEKVDSALIQSGKFYIERPVAGEALSTVLAIPRAYALPFVAEEGTILADLTAIAGKGTPLNDAYAQMMEQVTQATEGVREKIQAIRSDKSLSSEQKKAQQEAILKDVSSKLSVIAKEALQAHPNDAIGLQALQDLLSMEDVTLSSAENYLTQVGEKLRTAPSITKIIELLRRQEATKAGAMFTDFAGVDSQNKPVRLSDYVGKGHYVLVDFWASWCGPCRREITHLKKVRDTYASKGLVILGAVVWDEMADHLQAIKDLQVTWPQILNKNEPTELYGISGIPQVMLFDPTGKIVQRDLRGEAIDQLLDSILKTTGGKL